MQDGNGRRGFSYSALVDYSEWEQYLPGPKFSESTRETSNGSSVNPSTWVIVAEHEGLFYKIDGGRRATKWAEDPAMKPERLRANVYPCRTMAEIDTLAGFMFEQNTAE